MTQVIQQSLVDVKNIMTSYSRYLRQNVILWGENKLLTFNLYVRLPYIPTGTEQITVITKGIEYRPDLLAFDVYGTPNFWWSILEANKMKDVFEFKSGKTIILPSLV